MLSVDDALAVIGKRAAVEELLEHRRLRLLQLQEEGVLAVQAEQQRDPGARAHAADTHHLARKVGQLELLEQHAPVVLKRRPIAAQQLVQPVPDFIALAAIREVRDRHDQGWIGDDAHLPVDLVRELGEG